MRIKKISVKNLFGIFNHEIPFKTDDHITIIHGPNGFGKTILLTMIKTLFSPRYNDLRNIPFEEFSVDFNDDACLRVKNLLVPNDKDKAVGYKALALEYTKPGSPTKHYSTKPIMPREVHIPRDYVDDLVPGLERTGSDSWIYLPTRESLSLDDIIDRFADRFPPSIRKVLQKSSIPGWVKSIINSVPIRFIETQRLLSLERIRRHRESERGSQLIPAVSRYSKELVVMIQSKLAEYASLSQSLDRDFPTRLVQGAVSSKLTIEQLRENLKELENKRARLMTNGLLDPERETAFQDLQTIDESKRDVLLVYVEDVKKKLDVFDELNNKIDLLVSIVNKKFLHKKMIISKKDGFIFETANGKNLSPKNLSSGEQHELVLLYELLFKINPGALILIDEPELSLHVGWQEQFLKDLQEIANLAEFDFLVATHSPLIINDRWDLAVELKIPKNE